MKTRQIPAILMLVAGLITCIISFLSKVELIRFLINLSIILVVFFVLGEVIRYIIDINFATKEEKEETQEEETEQVEQETDSKEEKQ